MPPTAQYGSTGQVQCMIYHIGPSFLPTPRFGAIDPKRISMYVSKKVCKDAPPHVRHKRLLEVLNTMQRDLKSKTIEISSAANSGKL
jgi:hypothetical protein